MTICGQEPSRAKLGTSPHAEDPSRPHRSIAGAQGAAHVRTLGGQNPLARKSLGPRAGVAGLHRGRPLHRARLDRMDAGLPVRQRHSAIRRHRRARVSGRRPAPDCDVDGAAREPYGCPRPRVQQREHVWEPAPAHGRRAHRGRRLGAALLRNRAEGFGRGAGRALVADVRWRRVHLLLQWAAFAVCGHHPVVARAAGKPSAGAWC